MEEAIWITEKILPGKEKRQYMWLIAFLGNGEVVGVTGAEWMKKTVVGDEVRGIWRVCSSVGPCRRL